MRVGLTTSIATAIAVGVLIASGGGGGGNCALPAYPDASCVGVPAGTTLTAYTGPNPVTANDTVIDSKTLGCIEIQAQNVVIKNSSITCLSDFAVFLNDGPGWNNWSVTVQDTDINCGGYPAGANNSIGLGSAFITARRVDIVGCENGLDVNQSIDVRDSYIHDMRQCSAAECGGDGSHTDGAQFADHYSPAGSNTIANGALNVTLIHNTIMSMKPGSPTPDSNADDYTTSAIIQNVAKADTNVTIQSNLLAGGSFTLYCHTGGSANNITITDNHFSTRYKSTVGFSGPASECSDETVVSGNVYDETGLPVDMG